MSTTGNHTPDPTAIRERILELCGGSELPEPDLILNVAGEVIALWFDGGLAVIVGPDGEANEHGKELVGLLGEIGRRIGWLCEQTGFPRPDRMAFDRHPFDGPRKVSFAWEQFDRTYTWEIDEFLGWEPDASSASINGDAPRDDSG